MSLIDKYLPKVIKTNGDQKSTIVDFPIFQMKNLAQRERSGSFFFDIFSGLESKNLFLFCFLDVFGTGFCQRNSKSLKKNLLDFFLKAENFFSLSMLSEILCFFFNLTGY